MKANTVLLPLAALALASSCARAECTRDITVPVSSNGASVIIDGDNVSGIYPDLLRTLGPKNACHFVFTVVPRARQVAMFESGKADLLVPASRTPKRDQFGVFVPMIGHRAMLVSVASARPAIRSAQELLERRELRVAVVRGFDYGDQYGALVRELEKQGRLFVEVDVVAVARLLHAGSADLTIMGPTVMAGAIRRDPRIQGLQERLRFETIPELPWSDSGIYISKLTLKPQDQAGLQELFDKAGKSGAVMEGYHHHFRTEVLADSVRPR